MFILGINSFHGDASACLFQDSTLVAAAEEERFRRLKHWAGFPSQAIQYCLNEAGINLQDVDHIAINHDAQANLGKKILYTVTQRPELALVLDRIRNKRKRDGIEALLKADFPGNTFKGQVHQVEHHLAHLASAFHVSPFPEAVAVSVDGFGDFASSAWGVGRGTAIDVDDRIYFPHSLGIFYQALTQFIGFPHYGDEYKVMGLAPYGTPRFLPEMRKIVLLQPDGTFRLDLQYFRHHNQKVEYEWEGGIPSVGTLFSGALAQLLGPARSAHGELGQREKDIASSVQAMYEEAFFHLLHMLHNNYKLDALALAGGCAMNSVANGKIRLQSPFKQVYVQSAAGDAGGAIGSASVVWHRLGGARVSHHDHAYWGPSYSSAQIQQALAIKKEDLLAQNCQVEFMDEEDRLYPLIASAIASGHVIGWFQGRMEWGPRALGNRSILGDPRRADMKDILNSKIKRRESFRPFAPSVLRESVGEWFEQDGDVPFMMQVYQVREGKRHEIPAVTHVDGSGRLQTVCMETNVRYHRLISAFNVLTGVPLVLNTSFNENEPVVCQPMEALDCFLRTKMDYLVMGDWVVHRKGESISGHMDL